MFKKISSLIAAAAIVLASLPVQAVYAPAPRETVVSCAITAMCDADKDTVTVVAQGCYFEDKGGWARPLNRVVYWDATGEHRLELPAQIPAVSADVTRGGSGYNLVSDIDEAQLGDDVWFRIDRGNYSDAAPDSNARVTGAQAIAKDGNAGAGVDAVLTTRCPR